MKTMISVLIILAFACTSALVMAAETDAKAKETVEKAKSSADNPTVENPTVENTKVQTLCPVTGKEIDKKFFADYEGKRIYFCCENCPAEFKKDPSKYVKKLTDEGVVLENTPKPQTICPVMNEKINKKFFTDYEGKRVYFCCGMCPGMFKKNPEKYMKILNEQGVTLENAPKSQTMCPVTDKAIDKKYFADYEGKRIYFCCPACPVEFMKDPHKYIEKLQDAGIELEKTPIK